MTSWCIPFVVSLSNHERSFDRLRTNERQAQDEREKAQDEREKAQDEREIDVLVYSVRGEPFVQLTRALSNHDQPVVPSTSSGRTDERQAPFDRLRANDLLVYIFLSTHRGRGGWSVVVVVGVEVGIVGVAVVWTADVLAAVVVEEIVLV